MFWLFCHVWPGMARTGVQDTKGMGKKLGVSLSPTSGAQLH